MEPEELWLVCMKLLQVLTMHHFPRQQQLLGLMLLQELEPSKNRGLVDFLGHADNGMRLNKRHREKLPSGEIG